MATSDAGQRADETSPWRARPCRGDDPAPPEVQAAARAAFSCRWVEADVATLAFDSVMAGSRGRGARHLVFRGEGLTVEVDVAPDRSVIGRLLPPLATEVVLRWPGGSQRVRSDDQGCFSLEGVPRGPATLRFPARADGGEGPVGTEWIVF